MTTYRAALALTGTTVPDHLVADAEVPVLVGPQAQGDLMVFRKAVPADLEWRPLPAEGLRLVEGEATGNTHWLHPGFDSPGVRWAPVENKLTLGYLEVPDGQSQVLLAFLDRQPHFGREPGQSLWCLLVPE